MEKRAKRISPLAEAEMEVLEEGREWMRRRLEKKLKRLAEDRGEISPPERAATDSLSSASDSVDDKRGGGRC